MAQNAILTDLGIRAVGRAPIWDTQDASVVAPTAAPTLATNGISVQNSVLALIGVTDNGGIPTTWDGLLWGLPDGDEIAPADRPGWLPIMDGEFATMTGGTILRVNIAGFRRVYLQITAIGGGSDLAIAIGPCDTEG